MAHPRVSNRQRDKPLARARLRDGGELGHDQAVQTARGERAFAAGDRLMFLSNERSNLASLIFQEVSRKPKLASLVIANADGEKRRKIDKPIKREFLR